MRFIRSSLVTDIAFFSARVAPRTVERVEQSQVLQELCWCELMVCGVPFSPELSAHLGPGQSQGSRVPRSHHVVFWMDTGLTGPGEQTLL